MKRLITSLVLIGLFVSCVSSLSISPDVKRNLKMNTTEIVANGQRWDMTLPPNFKVLSRNFTDNSETMRARSCYYVGDRYVIIDVVAQDWEEPLTPNDLYVASHDQLTKLEGWNQTLDPTMMTLGDKQGYLEIGTTGSTLVSQLTFLIHGNSYILRCMGDNDTKTRVFNKCQELLGRFQPKAEVGQPKR